MTAQPHPRARPASGNRRDWPTLAIMLIAACGARDAPNTSPESIHAQAIKVDVRPADTESGKTAPSKVGNGAKTSAASEAANAAAVSDAASCDQTPPDAKPDVTRFVVVGDYGQAGAGEAAVAKLIKSWKPEFILTVGDNNYPYGETATIDNNIGYYFREFICPYKGSHGEGGKKHRFFPALGNHDWYSTGAAPYLDFFELPGNERYYDVRWGNVHAFVLDTDPNEPDGIDPKSKQAEWLAKVAAKSDAPWQLVTGHHPPYSSASHGNDLNIQWAFKDYGIDLALFGHDHSYERLQVDGLTYIVNGLGGRGLYPFENVLPESQVRFNDTLGAQLIEASATSLMSRFYDIKGTLIDEFTLEH